MAQSREDRIDRFKTEIFDHVEGWLGDRVSDMINILGQILEENQVRGHVVEFGVHHGLFLFLIDSLRNEGEISFAIDVFERQEFNIDRSGGGSLAIFRSHFHNFIADPSNNLQIIQRDTLSFSIFEMIEIFGKNGVKFFSIDAGHTVLHTYNDLHLCQEVLAPGGIIALDDYLSVHWPGVTEGFYKFMGAGNRRLRPLFYFQNKLFLTTISEQASYLRQFRAALDTVCPEEVQAGRWKDVEIAGSACLSFA